MRATLAILKQNGGTMRCLDIAREVANAAGKKWGSYQSTYQDLNRLLKAGLVEKVTAAEMVNRHEFDGRVVYLGPDAGAVGWRAVLVDAEQLDALEAAYAAPASEVDH